MGADGQGEDDEWSTLGLVMVWGLAHIQMWYPGNELCKVAQMQPDPTVGDGFPTFAGVQQIWALCLLGSFENGSASTSTA